MKRRGFAFVTCFSLVLTATVMSRAGWFAAAHGANAWPRRAEARTSNKIHDPLETDAGMRWKRGQATHWRSCLLQR